MADSWPSTSIRTNWPLKCDWSTRCYHSLPGSPPSFPKRVLKTSLFKQMPADPVRCIFIASCLLLFVSFDFLLLHFLKTRRGHTPASQERANFELPFKEGLARIFDRANGKEWDYVFNCGGETRYSQEDEVYKLRSLNLSLALGREVARRKVKVFVELSTGMVYKSDSSPSKETDKLKPWSKIAVFKLQAEQELAKIEG